MVIHQIGMKLRQQIHYFSGELSASLGKVSTRFVEEMVYGISSSGSVRLTEVSRALEEDISQHATHKRLSRNLAREELESTIGENILKLGASRINDRTLLIVDPSDLQKKYARKMEYLARVRDGSEGSLGRGYWICEVVGCEAGLKEIIPLAQELWSQDAPDFVSENEQVLSLVDRVRKATGGKGVVVYDRGGDRRKLLIPWTKDASCRYLIRQRGDRYLRYRGKARSVSELGELCKTPYGCTLIKEKKEEEVTYFIHFGFLPVRLPEYPDRPLFLVVVKGMGKKPLMLLTTEPMRLNRKVLWWAVEAYLTRWRVEDTIRFIKQSYDFEDVRVLTYTRLKNMAVFVLATSYFAAVWLGKKTKLNILALHTVHAAKRVFGIPDFRYYALADGIKTIFKRIGKGPLIPEKHKTKPYIQLSFWNL
jgi:hypothetical protein